MAPCTTAVHTVHVAVMGGFDACGLTLNIATEGICECSLVHRWKLFPFSSPSIYPVMNDQHFTVGLLPRLEFIPERKFRLEYKLDFKNFPLCYQIRAGEVLIYRF